MYRRPEFPRGRVSWLLGFDTIVALMNPRIDRPLPVARGTLASVLNVIGVLASAILFAAAALSVAGCNGKPALIPNSDESLRKDSTVFAADAAKRHYESDAPRVASAPFRAEIGVMLTKFDLANTGDAEWDNVEVWVNKQYVVFVPKFEAKTSKTLDFQMFFDANGNHFDTKGGQNPVKSLEIYHDGKMYSVTTQLSD
jgi:hypothetical protein